MEYTSVEHFRASTNHNLELLEYVDAAYIECIDDMIKIIIDKEIEVAISILKEVKNSNGPLTSPF